MVMDHDENHLTSQFSRPVALLWSESEADGGAPAAVSAEAKSVTLEVP